MSGVNSALAKVGLDFGGIVNFMQGRSYYVFVTISLVYGCECGKRLIKHNVKRGLFDRPKL